MKDKSALLCSLDKRRSHYISHVEVEFPIHKTPEHCPCESGEKSIEGTVTFMISYGVDLINVFIPYVMNHVLVAFHFTNSIIRDNEERINLGSRIFFIILCNFKLGR